MFIVGLTGGIGSGKTTVANEFAALGIDLVDADQLSREAVLPGMDALNCIAERFGESILTPEGELNRTALRNIVFHAPEERRWLEALLHPVIRDMMIAALEQSTSDYGILVSPLLLETSQHELVDRILVVDVTEETQLQRAMRRDGSDESTIRGIIEAQISRKARLGAADDIIDNELPMETLPDRVLILHKRYCEMAESK